MSSTCPIGNDQPIDQLKVTELNDELKRTKLVTKGLKEDLINCLDEVLAIEKEKDDVNGFNGNASDTVVTKSCSKTDETDEKVNTAKVHPIETENEEMNPEVVNNDSGKSDMTKQVGNASSAMVGQGVEHMDLSAGADSANVVEDLVHSSTKETAVTVAERVLTEAAVVSVQEDSCIVEPPNGDGQDSVIKQENEESKPQPECDIKPPCEHLTLDSLLSENQISEVNLSLGSQVKSDSVSSNWIEVEELDEKKAFVEENSSNNKSPNLDKTNTSEDVGYPEKLNLDSSSGDDSMEEDLPESKQFDSKFNVDELGVKGESVERPIVKEERGAAVVGDGLSSEKGGTDHNNNIPSVSLVKKQKLHDRISVRNNQPAKRQRMWNSETVKGSNPQMSTVRPATAPKGEPNALKRNLSWSDSSAINDAPKERIVPPSQRSPTNSLRIDNFLRPFTLKAVHELLDKTGNFTSFWMDEIKTHCYVSYSTVEEATETRNAVYNLQWPSNGGRLLVAEYVDPQEVQMKLGFPHVAINNDSTVPPETPTSLPEPSPCQHREQPPVPVTFPPPTPLSQLPPAAREWLPPPPLLSGPPQPLLSDPLPAARERLPPPPPLSELPPAAREQLPLPQSLPENVNRPIRTIDDVFRKTIATPQIYYLPLSEEQVAAKLAAGHRSIEQ
ncbi:apoptotic chromatin condensation inducer in the nucleus [Trifolium repens]|nr:apoptotic chromatin condensation inducer in the nucleus [Trifolium repens]